MVDYQIILLGYLTDRQATTVKRESDFWNPFNALLIYNIDTCGEAGEMNGAELMVDGFIPRFQAEGDYWSFVRLNDVGKAVEIKREKADIESLYIGFVLFQVMRVI